MINKIKLDNCIPYKHSEISDCKKINFIYGANGSGKSTISSYLAGTTDTRFGESSIEWSSANHEKIEVYNKAFRIANLEQNMKGIFTLGSSTIEDIKELEKLNNELTQKNNELDQRNKTYKEKEEVKINRESDFKDAAWEKIFKKNEADFKNAFDGVRSNKNKFIDELKNRMVGIPNQNGKICNRQDLLLRSQTLYGTNNEKVDRLIIDINKQQSAINNIIDNPIWNTVIVGSQDVDIAELINELDNSSWISQGMNYIKYDSKKCPFCQQETITESFRQKLELFFDTTYSKKIEAIKDLFSEYNELKSQILFQIDSIISNNDKAIQIGKLDLEMLKVKRELLQKTFSSNMNNIQEKIKEPGQKIIIEDVSDIIAEISRLVDNANMLIESHNKLVSERDKAVIELRDDVWTTFINEESDFLNEYKKDISKLDKALTGIKKSIDCGKEQIRQLKNTIEEKEKNVTSVRPAITEINNLLMTYGFTNFRIEPAEGMENYYCIKRDDGTLATNTLSEGEETFLTFLYFMQNVKGSIEQAHVSDKKIIVLDDPISSLDSTILYIVGTMVKNLAKEIRDGRGNVTQLFVFTHNVFFHKEASFIEGRNIEIKDVNYWILRKYDGVAEIRAYGQENPISTSYDLLWSELRDDKNVSRISIQNTMRRIIENYFGMLGNKRDSSLISNFKSAEEQIVASSLFAWINDGSHSIADDLYVDSSSDIVKRYKKVFRDIFEKSGHLAHYNMMMGINEETE